MKPHLDDEFSDVSVWVWVPDALDTDDANATCGWLGEHDGEFGRIGIDDDMTLTLDQAMRIANQYGGGEFDNECAGIVAALCVLRDHIKTVTP